MAHQCAEAVFISWLSSNVPSDQLTDLYLAYHEIETEAKKTGLVKKSLYENLDVAVAKKICERIAQSRTFKNSNRKQWRIVLSALDYLQQFAGKKGSKDKTSQASSSVTRKDVLSEDSTIPYREEKQAGDSVSPEREPESIRAPEGMPQASYHELDTFLVGDEFLPLRKVLDSLHVTTVDELRNQKLWAVMNRYDVYSIGMRQQIFAKVSAMLNPVENVSDEHAYVLKVGAECYKGSTPAETFRLFCDTMRNTYPLQLRFLVGMKRTGGGIPVCKNGDDMPSLKLRSLPAFIRADLSVEQVVDYAKWVRDKCGEGSEVVTMSVPQKEEITADITLNGDAGIHPAAIAGSTSPKEPTLRPLPSKNISPYVRKLEGLVRETEEKGLFTYKAKDVLRATEKETRCAIEASEHIVVVQNRLLHEDAFVGWKDGADQLEEIMDKLMQKNGGYISAAQLYEYARVEMYMFIMDNGINDEQAVFDLARHLFQKRAYHGKHFSFVGKHISRTDHPIENNLDIFKNYASEQGGIFLYESLVEYLQSVGVATGNVRAQMRIPDEPIFFCYSVGTLMYADSMHMDEEWMAAVREKLKLLFADVGDHAVLRKLPDIWLEQLPDLPLGKPWTRLLLQSVLRCCGKELGARTIQAMKGQSLETLHAMLVANDSPIRTFGDVVISQLVDHEIEERSFDAENLRLLLVDTGVIHGSELIGNMAKVLSHDERFAWDASGDHVIVKV